MICIYVTSYRAVVVVKTSRVVSSQCRWNYFNNNLADCHDLWSGCAGCLEHEP